MAIVTSRPHATQDPREVLDWGIDWTPVLEPGEVVMSCTWSVDPSQQDWGVVLTPLVIENGIAYVRIDVAIADQAHARWIEPGVDVLISAEAVTGDGREFVRTFALRLVRGARSPAERVMDA